MLAGISDGAMAKAEGKMRAALSAAGVSDASTQNNIISLAYNKMMADGNPKLLQQRLCNIYSRQG